MASFKDCVLFAHRLLSRSRVFLALTWLLLVCTVIVRYFVDYCECVREYVDAHARVCVCDTSASVGFRLLDSVDVHR